MENNYEEKRLEEIRKALFIIDMNNGFVNFGPMSNPKYNELVPEHLKLISIFRRENELLNFILEAHKKNDIEFNNYPEHCVIGTQEALLIPELLPEQTKPNTRSYYKNSINGMLNRKLQTDIKKLINLKYIVVGGVCADLCVMDFVLTLLRYLTEINKDVKVIIVKSTIDTYEAPNHNRKEWLDIAYKVLAQAGAIIVENVQEYEIVIEELETKERSKNQSNKLVRRRIYGK